MQLTFPLALLLLFVGLKLTNQIDWSWFWVTSPFWIPMSLAVGLYAIAGVLYSIARLIRNHARQARKL